MVTAKRLRNSEEVKINDNLRDKLYRLEKVKSSKMHINMNDRFVEQKDLVIQ